MGMIQIVDNLVKEHGGGQAYFTAMDKRVREEKGYLVATLASMADAIFGRDTHFVVSGAFGLHALNWISARFREQSYWTPGGIRHGEPVTFSRVPFGSTALYPIDVAELPERLVLLDDSYFRGRTLDAINVRSGFRVLGAVVAYDGSHDRVRSNVFSLYRWHDRR